MCPTKQTNRKTNFQMQLKKDHFESLTLICKWAFLKSINWNLNVFFNNLSFLLIRMNVKTIFVFWLKPIPVLYLFVAPIVSNPSVEPTQQFEKRPKLTRKTGIQQQNQRQLKDQKIRQSKLLRQLQSNHNWLTMEFWDWNMNFQALVFALLTPVTILQQFSQVNKQFLFSRNFSSLMLLLAAKIDF